jgi:hypothetical protein
MNERAKALLFTATSSDNSYFTHHLSEHVSCHFSDLSGVTVSISPSEGVIPAICPSNGCSAKIQFGDRTVRIRTSRQSPKNAPSIHARPGAKIGYFLDQRPFPDIAILFMGITVV